MKRKFGQVHSALRAATLTVRDLGGQCIPTFDLPLVAQTAGDETQ